MIDDKTWYGMNYYEQAAYFLENRFNPGQLLKEAGGKIRELQSKYDEATHLIADLVKQIDELNAKLKKYEK